MSDTMQNAASAFGRLSSREQVLVVVLAVVLVLGLALGISFLVSKRLHKSEDNLREHREQLAMIEALEGRYKQAEQEQLAQRQRLQRNSVQLFSLLTKTTREVGLEVDNLNERTTPLKEAGVNETCVDVSLKELSITKLNKILEKLEGPQNNGLVKVSKLKTKTSFKDKELLDVNLTVCTYKLMPGSAPADPGDGLGGAP